MPLAENHHYLCRKLDTWAFLHLNICRWDLQPPRNQGSEEVKWWAV
jgi:hypothetical protein